MRWLCMINGRGTSKGEERNKNDEVIEYKFMCTKGDGWGCQPRARKGQRTKPKFESESALAQILGDESMWCHMIFPAYSGKRHFLGKGSRLVTATCCAKTSLASSGLNFVRQQLFRLSPPSSFLTYSPPQASPFLSQCCALPSPLPLARLLLNR